MSVSPTSASRCAGASGRGRVHGAVLASTADAGPDGCDGSSDHATPNRYAEPHTRERAVYEVVDGNHPDPPYELPPGAGPLSDSSTCGGGAAGASHATDADVVVEPVTWRFWIASGGAANAAPKAIFARRPPY